MSRQDRGIFTRTEVATQQPELFRLLQNRFPLKQTGRRGVLFPESPWTYNARGLAYDPTKDPEPQYGKTFIADHGGTRYDSPDQIESHPHERPVTNYQGTFTVNYYPALVLRLVQAEYYAGSDMPSSSYTLLVVELDGKLGMFHGYSDGRPEILPRGQHDHGYLDDEGLLAGKMVAGDMWVRSYIAEIAQTVASRYKLNLLSEIKNAISSNR